VLPFTAALAEPVVEAEASQNTDALAHRFLRLRTRLAEMRNRVAAHSEDSAAPGASAKAQRKLAEQEAALAALEQQLREANVDVDGLVAKEALSNRWHSWHGNLKSEFQQAWAQHLIETNRADIVEKLGKRERDAGEDGSRHRLNKGAEFVAKSPLEVAKEKLERLKLKVEREEFRIQWLTAREAEHQVQLEKLRQGAGEVAEAEQAVDDAVAVAEAATEATAEAVTEAAAEAA